MALLPPPPSNIPPAPVPTAVDLVYQNLRPIQSLRDYDNYVVNNQFSAHAPFSCNLSLDFVKVFIPPSLANSVQVAKSLCSLGCPVNLVSNFKGNFSSIYSGIKYDIRFDFIRNVRGYFGCLIQIFRPDHAVLCHLDQVFSGLYLISQIEFTADLFCQHPGELFTLVASTAFLLWAGQDLRLAYPTRYLGNPRKTRNKAGRVYLKEINGQVAVRVELVFKRGMIKKTCPGSLTALNTIRAEKIFNLLHFKQIKTDMVRKRFGKVFMKRFNGNTYILRLSTYYFRAWFSVDIKLGVKSVLNVFQSMLGKNTYSVSHPFQARFRSIIHGQHFV